MTIFKLILIISVIFVDVNAVLRSAIQGTKCSKNQAVYKLTVYEDGAIEAECGPIPCGESGINCLDDQPSCKAEADVFSGLKWAKNGQSLLLRCCSINTDNKIYVGTDLVTLGSYYTGGLVPKKDMYGISGSEYDYVASVRTEQGGVRIWVYRMICPDNSQKSDDKKLQRKISERMDPTSLNDKQISENIDVPSEQVAQNPLQFRPQTQSQKIRL